MEGVIPEKVTKHGVRKVAEVFDPLGELLLLQAD